MILVFMNITMNTIGFYNARRGKMKVKESMHQIFIMPCIYAIPLALLFKYLNYLDSCGAF